MTMKQHKYRIEEDLIGELEVPAHALYGVQTQRAIALYPLNGEKPLSAYPELLRGLLQVKKLAAQTNIKTGEINPTLGQAIILAVDELLEEMPAEPFPVHAFHGGGGISSNMNVNEVIANLANRNSFDRPLGSYDPVHPNDHVNLNNSTSDALNTACHLAVIGKVKELNGALKVLIKTFDDQGQKWQDVLKISRTCLQDAVEISFADLFGGYASLLERNRRRLDTDVGELYKVNLGGNIIGRRGDCSETFFNEVIEGLNLMMGGARFSHNDNLFDASQSHDDLARVATGLDQLARALLRIAKDFRLMASGPATGFGEIRLPAVQPGSSAMPGKVNPTIPEYLIQCCMQACGRCYSVQMTQDHGELDYTPWQSVVISNLLDTMSVLTSGIEAFRQHCLTGMEPDLERNAHNVNTLIPTLTRLKQARGYSFASRVYKETGGDLQQIRRYLEE
jgi:aspartate ammonia-lyase